VFRRVWRGRGARRVPDRDVGLGLHAGRGRHLAAVRSGGAQCYRNATAVGVTGRGSADSPVSLVSAAAAAARPSAMAHTISD